MPAAHPLDNVIWSALTHRHQAALALGDGAARRYPAEFAPFGAMVDASAAGFRALAGLLTPGEQVALVTAGDVAPTAEFEILLQKPIVQMVQSKPSGDQAADPRMAPLGPDDATDMRALAELTKPGPFSSRTQELGAFLGVRENGRLVAMAGERMHLDGNAEVSAVCTHPDVRGRGLARALVTAVSARIAARGEIPFLHAFKDNDSAIALYASLGFDLRATLRLTVLRRQPAAG
ncbi:GNAT family N-acetyltransferase [Variovorax sp. PBL-E5]|uniref:GNAT family N-acetyltransferase n=1 Tax=Variovorax sp. PBL-E5 TaxID=434014 RepID=UPI001317DBA4|nr:GNAT family N-acetyltransferase [Variovorax sp. PBL-E5]VTU20838.1 putative acetyltransferase [Variovorax sp. PBL-E5]